MNAYEIHKAELKDSILNIFYGEYKLIKRVTDSVLGLYEYDKELYKEYYYSVAFPSGEVLGLYEN